MQIFLTGATGYLGGALARRLLEQGHTLHALVRSPERAAGLATLGARLFVGDITDRISLREGMAGSDWVIHAAAHVQLQGDLEAMKQANVDGSENVASLAYKLGVGRVLSISSMAFFGGSPSDGSLANEDTPPQVPFPNPYSATKHAGQLRFREWARQGLRLNTVYPSLIYGPPGKAQGANSILRRLVRGGIPVIVAGDRRLSWIFIDDVVEALVRLLDRAPVGRDYLLAGEVVAIERLFRQVCQLAGVKAPRLRLPLGLVRLLAGIGGPLLRAVGRRPPFADGELESLARHWAFDDRRAQAELGWHPRPLSDGLPPTIASFAR